MRGAAALLPAAALLLGAEARNVLVDFPPKKLVYRQTVDHFSFASAETFEQYWVYDKFWDRPVELGTSATPPVGGGKPLGPILFYMGGEGQVDGFYNATSVLFESLGPELKALIVFSEHRYYGNSTPPATGASGLERYRHLSIEQALADYAELLVHLRKSLGCDQDRASCPTFLFGGSYGGMLVGWFRLKYPHLSTGGVMSSAPVNFYLDQDSPRRFWQNVMHTFGLAAGEACVSAVEATLASLDTLPAGPASMRRLAATFNVCGRGETGEWAPFLAKLKMYIRGALAGLAMVDYPFPWKLLREMPARPVKLACAKMLQPAAGLQDRLAALNGAVDVYVGDAVPCKNVERELVSNATEARDVSSAEDMDMEPWNFQACTELPLQPLTSDYLGFYPPDEGAMEDLYRACRQRFGSGLQTRPGFLPVTYGMGEVVERDSLSYAIIVDGSGAQVRRHAAEGLPEIITRGTLVQIEPVAGAAHHQDLIGEHPEDSPELLAARAAILAQLKAWAAGEPGTCWDRAETRLVV